MSVGLLFRECKGRKSGYAEGSTAAARNTAGTMGGCSLCYKRVVAIELVCGEEDVLWDLATTVRRGQDRKAKSKAKTRKCQNRISGRVLVLTGVADASRSGRVTATEQTSLAECALNRAKLLLLRREGRLDAVFALLRLGYDHAGPMICELLLSRCVDS